jgi:hypothetical protein
MSQDVYAVESWVSGAREQFGQNPLTQNDLCDNTGRDPQRELAVIGWNQFHLD